MKITLLRSEMANRHLLSEIDISFRLLGIGSALKEYKLCFHLNTIFDCDFIKLQPQVFEKPRGRKVQFSVFRSADEDNQSSLYVFSNKNLGDVLLPELKKFDYFVQIHGNYSDADIHALVDRIKEVPEVVMCVEIPMEKIKHPGRLIYE